MGQAVLSHPVTRFRDDGCPVCIKYMCFIIFGGSPAGAKGNRVNILDPANGDRRRLAGLRVRDLCPGVVKRGNANELGDVGKSFGKSYLFFVRMVSTPGIGLSGDRGITSVKHHPSCGVRNAPVGP